MPTQVVRTKSQIDRKRIIGVLKDKNTENFLGEEVQWLERNSVVFVLLAILKNVQLTERVYSTPCFAQSVLW